MAAPPVVVLDTNVLESALRSPRGASFALLSQVGLGAFEIAVSVPLVLEYEAVLLREPNRKAATINDLVDFLCAVAVRQTIFFRWRPYLPDPGDDMLLELARGCALPVHNHLQSNGILWAPIVLAFAFYARRRF